MFPKFATAFSVLSLLLVTTTASTQSPEGSSSSTELSGTSIPFATSFQVESKLLEQTRRINVYLPPTYAKGKQEYPVLYLLDGGMQEDFLHIVGIASLAADFRNLREFVVVGIEGVDRYHDLTPPSESEEDRKQIPTHGGAEKFRAFLGSELKPWVERTFRASKESVLIGESIAGLFVAETFVHHPELFSGYICVSPSLWWDNQKLPSQAARLIKEKRKALSGKRIYLTIGNEKGAMREGFDALASALRASGPSDFELIIAPLESESHGTVFHPAALEALRAFFKIRSE
ncbi:MAG: alpha/beta hydrolase [Deltaproteobacteria bacterium]|nr:alpha/beta hydrolase [Deltaproteobacteria bacterium]